MRKAKIDDDCNCQTPLDEWRTHRNEIIEDCEDTVIHVTNIGNHITSCDDLPAVPWHQLDEAAAQAYATRAIYYKIVEDLVEEVQECFKELLRADGLLNTTTKDSGIECDVDALAEYFHCKVMDIQAASLTFNVTLERLKVNHIFSFNDSEQVDDSEGKSWYNGIFQGSLGKGWQASSSSVLSCKAPSCRVTVWQGSRVEEYATTTTNTG